MWVTSVGSVWVGGWGGGVRSLAKFLDLQKFDFHLYKGFRMGKNGSNSQDFERRNNYSQIRQMLMIS